jgi:hypothetical protein
MVGLDSSKMSWYPSSGHNALDSSMNYILLNHLNLLKYNYIVVPASNEFYECIISCGRVCKKSSQGLSRFALKTQFVWANMEEDEDLGLEGPQHG